MIYAEIFKGGLTQVSSQAPWSKHQFSVDTSLSQTFQAVESFQSSFNKARELLSSLYQVCVIQGVSANLVQTSLVASPASNKRSPTTNWKNQSLGLPGLSFPLFVDGPRARIFGDNTE